MTSVVAAALRRIRFGGPALVALMALALLAGGCSAGGPGGLAGFYHQELSWSGCRDGLECASLTVPLNYADPGGQTIQLAVIRARATDPAHRIGSLITNPGGPGGSGLQFLRESLESSPGEPALFSPTLRAHFDILSFDPRGVGRSAPVNCLDDAQLDRYTALNSDPTTPTQTNTLVAEDKRFVAACQARSGMLLPYVGTPNAARDMDVLRAALGDQKLYYLGYSYGTYLGAVYAGLFGDRVGRAVLDGPLPTDLPSRELDLQQSAGFQLELTRFLADCVTHPDCPLGTDPATAQTRLLTFLAAAQTNPVPTNTGRGLNGALAQTGVIDALYESPTSWPQLRTALADALSGRGKPLLKLADEYNDRHHDGHYDNTSAANMAINCLDHPTPVRSPADVRAELPAFQRASAFTGPEDAWSELVCAYWPVPAQSQPAPVHYAGRPPILVVGNTDDPATPYADARDMTRELGAAVLLTYNGDGHTAYGRGNTCVDNAVDTYLTTGTPPPADTVCQPIPAATPPG